MATAKYNCVTRANVKVRNAPNTANTATKSMPQGTNFQASDIIPDSLDPTNAGKRWAVIFGGQYDGMYTAIEYPGNISPISNYELIGTIPPPPPPDPDPVFPESFTLTDDATGKKAQYIFIRVIE